MSYSLRWSFKGIRALSDNDELVFKSKFLSLTSTLVDSNNNVLATMKRTGWWNYTFLITCNDKTYEYQEGTFSGEPTIKGLNNKAEFFFRTDGFYLDYAKRKGKHTESNLVNRFASFFKRQVNVTFFNESEYEYVLLISHCYLFKRYIQMGP